MSTTLALYQIEETLSQLFEVRDQAEVDGDSEALIAIDREIDAYMTREVRKVDGVCEAIRYCELQAGVAQREAQRIADHAKAWEARRDRIKASALRAMQTFGVRVLETPTNKLRVQGNGGLQPLEVTQAVPEELVTYTVTMSSACMKEISAHVKGRQDFIADRQPHQGRIREALKRGEVVPGAFLKERGVHLRVE